MPRRTTDDRRWRRWTSGQINPVGERRFYSQSLASDAPEHLLAGEGLAAGGNVCFPPLMRHCDWSVNDPKPDVSFRLPAAPNRQSR